MSDSFWAVIAQHSGTEKLWKKKIYSSQKLAEHWAERFQQREYNPMITFVVREFRVVK